MQSILEKLGIIRQENELFKKGEKQSKNFLL